MLLEEYDMVINTLNQGTQVKQRQHNVCHKFKMKIFFALLAPPVNDLWRGPCYEHWFSTSKLDIRTLFNVISKNLKAQRLHKIAFYWLHVFFFLNNTVKATAFIKELHDIQNHYT